MDRIEGFDVNYFNRPFNEIAREAYIKPFFDFSKTERVENPTKSESLYESWKSIYPNLSQEFFNDLTEMSERLNINPEDIAAIMYKESGFKPNALGSGKYYGLIQMDSDALKAAVKHAFETQGKDCRLDSKMNLQKFSKLSREEQLKYCEAYLQFRIDEKGLTGKQLTGGQLWTLIKCPAKINNSAFVEKLQTKVDKAKEFPQKTHVFNHKI